MSSRSAATGLDASILGHVGRYFRRPGIEVERAVTKATIQVGGNPLRVFPFEVSRAIEVEERPGGWQSLPSLLSRPDQRPGPRLGAPTKMRRFVVVVPEPLGRL